MDGQRDDVLPAGVETVADLLAGAPGESPAEGSNDGPLAGVDGTTPALSVADETVPVDYDRAGLGTDARKTSNLLAHLGVREGRTLAVADDPLPQPVVGLLGAALLGAVVRFVPADPGTLDRDGTRSDDGGPPDRPDDGVLDARAILAPGDVVAGYALPAGGQAIGYGVDPDDAAATYFEKQMWSENATVPPPTVEPGDPLLAAGGERRSHREVLAGAAATVAEHDLAAGDRVVVRASFRVPGTAIAGVLAPLLVGAEIVLAGGVEQSVGDVAVSATGAPEGRTVDPGAI